jgi:hypothetical protein
MMPSHAIRDAIDVVLGWDLADTVFSDAVIAEATAMLRRPVE